MGKNKGYLASLGVVAGAKLADSLSTKIGVDKFGTWIEANPVTRYFMDNLGTDMGLLAKNLPSVALAAGAAYLLNKANEGKGAFRENMGNIYMTGLATIPLYDAINNCYKLYELGIF